jgi:uncharacterized protein YndB with AHSA1/START domain
VHINREPADVFAAWSSAAALASWFAPMASENLDVEMEFAEGGTYSIAMPLPDGSVHTTKGVFREIVDNEKIVMTWRCDAFDDPETLVEVLFSPSGRGTEVRVRHETFASPETCTAHHGGWEACLGELARQLA